MPPTVYRSLTLYIITHCNEVHLGFGVLLYSWDFGLVVWYLLRVLCFKTWRWSAVRFRQVPKLFKTIVQKAFVSTTLKNIHKNKLSTYLYNVLSLKILLKVGLLRNEHLRYTYTSYITTNITLLSVRMYFCTFEGTFVPSNARADLLPQTRMWSSWTAYSYSYCQFWPIPSPR